MAARLALVLVLGAVLGAGRLRAVLERPPPRRECVPEGRGADPRRWLGCAADPGVARPLAPDEALALGLPIDPNVAGARDLAFVPGFTRRLAAEIVADRDRNGRYASVEELLRVRGLGPKRLATAAPHLRIAAP